MGKRVHQLCRVLAEQYQSQAANVWKPARTGVELVARLESLPGFGHEKAAIFTALLGKQREVRPAGWREAAGDFGDDGVFRSVADIVDDDSLGKVRATKQAVKAARKAPVPG